MTVAILRATQVMASMETGGAKCGVELLAHYRSVVALTMLLGACEALESTPSSFRRNRQIPQILNA